MPDIGWQELLLVLVVVLVIFGPKRLPALGRSLGKGVRALRRSSRGVQDHIESRFDHTSGQVTSATDAGDTEVVTGEVVSEETEQPSGAAAP